MKFVALTFFVVFTCLCSAIDLATQLTVSRIDYDLPELVKPAGPDSLVFRVFIRHALSESGYAVDGLLKFSKHGEVSGALTLVEPTSREDNSRTFILSRLQAQVVYGWFSNAKFLDLQSPESLQTPVLDGGVILIEGYHGTRYFRFHRNSGDSPQSATFFENVESFRIWKEEATHEQ